MTDQENRPSNAGNGFPKELVTVQNPAGVASEAYRIVRTNLFYAQVDFSPKVIVLTSAGPGEGTTTTVANLGVTLAQAGKDTLILDCDLRNGRLHRMFGARNTKGLVDVLVGTNKVQEVWQEPVRGLKLICAGSPTPYPAELLSSQRLVEFLRETRQKFDYVLVDTPPIGMSDSTVLAANGDAVLLILDAQHTPKGALRRALHSLQGVGANVLGTLVNKAEDGIAPLE
jgi:capsular exopolysaccharide synthesis family protein